MTAQKDFLSKNPTFAEQINWYMQMGTRPHRTRELGKPWGNKELAEMANVTDRQVRNWRTGKSSPLTTDTLERLFFGYNLTDATQERIQFRKAHCKAKYDFDLDDLSDSRELDWHEYDVRKFEKSIEVTIQALKYIKKSAISLGAELSDKNSKIVDMYFYGDFRSRLKEQSSHIPELENEGKITYASLCNNINGMIFIRKSIINLLDRGLSQHQIEQEELNRICGSLYETMMATTMLVDDFYEINTFMAEKGIDKTPKILHSFMADTYSAFDEIVEMLRFNHKTGDNETNIFVVEPYRTHIAKLKVGMEEIVTYLCDMELPK